MPLLCHCGQQSSGALPGQWPDAVSSPPVHALYRREEDLNASLCLQPRSQMLFPSKRKENRAVQVVEVQAPSRGGEPPRRPYTFTFCLERVDVGPYKVIAFDCKLPIESIL